MTEVGGVSTTGYTGSYRSYAPSSTFNGRAASHYESLYPSSASNPNGLLIQPYTRSSSTYAPGRLFRTSTQIPSTSIPAGSLTYNTGTDSNGRLLSQGYFHNGTFVRVGILPSRPATAAVSLTRRNELEAQAIRELDLTPGSDITENGQQVKTFTRAGYNGIYLMRNDGRLEYRPPTDGRPSHISGAQPPRQIYDLTTHMWHRYVPDVAPPREPSHSDSYIESPGLQGLAIEKQ